MLHGSGRSRVTRKSLSLKKSTKNKESGCTADISKYFQKKNIPDESSTKVFVDVALRESGEQPLAKRQRNNVTAEHNEITDLHNVQAISEIKECLNGCIVSKHFTKNIAFDSKVTKNGIHSASFTSIKETHPTASMVAGDKCLSKAQVDSDKLLQLKVKNGVNSVFFTSTKENPEVVSNHSCHKSKYQSLQVDSDCTLKLDAKMFLTSPDKPCELESNDLDCSDMSADENNFNPQRINDVKPETLSQQSIDTSDDTIIPPTPSRDTSKADQASINKNYPRKPLSNHRTLKVIKKPSISLTTTQISNKTIVSRKEDILSKDKEGLNTRRKLQNTVASKVFSSVKKNMNNTINFNENSDNLSPRHHDSLDVSKPLKENMFLKNAINSKMDEDFRDFSGDISKCADEKNVMFSQGKSSLQRARKTYKLSRKGRKTELRKLSVTLESVNGEDKQNCANMLAGYGMSFQNDIRCNDLVEQNQDVSFVDNTTKEESKTPMIQTRRKLSLGRERSLEVQAKETQIETAEKHETKLSHTQNNSLVTSLPDGENMLDFSMKSLNSDDVCQLMDDITWSPMKTDKNIVVSPAKQFVRSKSSELNSLARNISFSETTRLSTDSPKEGYQRFLVLEVYRREILDNMTAMNSGTEKVLRLFNECDNSERYCQLRGEWERTEVEHGDIVNIIGQPSSSGSFILDNENEKYIVVHPDILVTPTLISTSTKCLRRSVLDKYFKTEGPNQVMFIGTLLHRIFEASLLAKDFSAKFVLAEATQLLQQPSNLTELYGIGITEDEVLAKVSEFTTFLSEWGEKYFKSEPHPIHGVMDFKDGGVSRNSGDNQVALCISQVLDIEECVWSPKFGLKGQIDSSVEVKINRNPNIMKRNSSLNQTSILPLELKTGKLFTKLGSVEHRAQIILYSLIMIERYDNTLDTGLLLYLKAGHMLGVPAYKHEKRALVMKRNELIRYLSYAGTRLLQNMPGMLQNERSCKYCPQLNVCTLYHKSVEKGDTKSAGMGKTFDESTRHLSPIHLKYFSHWHELIALESKAMQENANDSDIWCLSGSAREKLGYCFSKMCLVSCQVSEVAGRFLNKFQREEEKSFIVCVADMHLVKGDYVVVSQEDGAIGLSTGFLSEILDESISVLLDKDLTKCYHHRNQSKTPVYRIDKAEMTTGATIQFSNLAKLFLADSEENMRLRRLIVDLESPRFSREIDVNCNISGCSEVSGTWSSQLSSCSMTSPVKSSQDYSELTQILQGLNSDQRNAIRKVLSAQDYALILGCPGAGKTHTIACLVRALVSLGKSVLLTSYTHSAVDNILLKLKQNNVDFLRLGSIQKVHPDIQSYGLHNAVKHIKTVKELKEFYEAKGVVATTCLGVNHTIFNQKSFDYCIVDEASQITEPVCIGSLRHASKFVLVGDHYQLPPLVQSQKARDDGMNISLFKRLSKCHPQAVVHLAYQYRMHKHIMLLSNSFIYEKRLKCATQEVSEALLNLPKFKSFRNQVMGLETQQQAQCTWLLQVLDPQSPVLFLDTDMLSALEVRSGHMVYNESEACLVASIVHAFIKSGLECEEIGVISPYRQQLKIIKQHLTIENKKNLAAQLNVEINTVDKYQGRDKLCVIVSLVRSNAGGHVGDLLRDWRRVNVAVTRAKRKLILLGSRGTLSHNMLFQELFTLLERHSWICTLPNSAWRGLLPW